MPAAKVLKAEAPRGTMYPGDQQLLGVGVSTKKTKNYDVV